MHIAPDNPVIESPNALHVNQPRIAMNTKTFARILLVSAAALIAGAGAEAKGSMSVGLTIVSSCSVNSASVYRAASSDVRSNATTTGVCANDTSSYTVSMSPVAKVESAAVSSTDQAGGKTDAGRAQGDAGYVVVTLTY